MRLTGDFRYPSVGHPRLALECRYMGQDLMNPPSVEGWHTGKEWIDTGILVERVNFAAEQVGDPSKPGIRRIVDRLRGQLRATLVSRRSSSTRCLDLIGPLRGAPSGRQTRSSSSPRRPARPDLADGDRGAEERVVVVLQLIVATREYQLA